MKHNNKGFSLVELIVVIAIMAILGGVGTAGYSKYIEQTNKKADIALVGNIMRAIETGTNSTMYSNKDSYDFGMAKIPVGFIVLNNNGSKVVTSESEVSYIEDSCVFATIEDVLVETKFEKESGCYTNESSTITSINLGTINYCTTHSPEPQIVNATGTYISDYNHSGTNKDYIITKKCDKHKWEPVNTPYPEGSKKVSNQSSLYTNHSNGLCELAYAQQNGIVISGDIKENITNEPIYEALSAAFDDVTSLKLKYDKWNSDESQGYATLYPAASGMMENVSELADTLAWASSLNDSAKTLLKLENSYEDSADLFNAVSDKFYSIYKSDGLAYPAGLSWDSNGVYGTPSDKISGKEAWLSHWDDAATYSDGMATFGYTENGTSGREHIYSMRRIYNESVASYIQANSTVSSTALEKIKEYAKAPDTGNSFINVTLNGVGAKFPLVVNEYTISDALTGENADTITTCTNLYKKYKDSESSDKNAIAVYDLLMNVSETGDLASNKNNGVYDSSKSDSENYMNYYNQYINELSSLYNHAQATAKNGIIVMVYTENGKVNFDVSPSAANPRNK